MLKTALLWSGIGVVCLFGCHDDEESATVCAGDYSQLPTAGVSLEHDLMPIFGASCTFSSCHDPTARKAGLLLGDPRAFAPDGGSCFDESAKWGCRIPMPIDANLLKDVRDSLLSSSTTVKEPAIFRVAPRDPGKSFLLDKLTGNQDGRGYTCESQEPTPTSPASCGGPMPFGDSNFCKTNPDKVSAIAEWIRDGAPQN